MPELLPFRGLLFDTKRSEASNFLAPPYDVIDADERASLLAKDPHNVARLILPDGDGDEKYANAADTVNTWLDKGVLYRDQRPSIYRYHQQYTIADLGDRVLTRRGFIAAIRLHEFSEGIILPHERTLKGPKIDRLKLMKATNSHLSQIFTMYSDPSGRSDELFRNVERKDPDLNGATKDGTRHLMWKVPDRELIGQLSHLISQYSLYIADGHHRYETMLALRRHYEEKNGGPLSNHSAAQFGTMFLVNMDDVGMVVLPTHRLIHSVKNFDGDAMLREMSQYFDLQTAYSISKNTKAVRELIEESSHRTPSFAIVFPDTADVMICSLKTSVVPEKLGFKGDRSVTGLDVSLLHELVLDRILGIDKAAQEAKTNIKYVKDTSLALKRANESQVSFIMNPPTLQQVRAVSDAGEVMPQKSTFFYPKIASGIVMNTVNPEEELY